MTTTPSSTLSYPVSVKLERFAVLTDDTYETWARTAKAHLIAGGYWPFFCGKRPAPKQDPWERNRFNLQPSCLFAETPASVATTSPGRMFKQQKRHGKNLGVQVSREWNSKTSKSSSRCAMNSFHARVFQGNRRKHSYLEWYYRPLFWDGCPNAGGMEKIVFPACARRRWRVREDEGEIGDTTCSGVAHILSEVSLVAK